MITYLTIIMKINEIKKLYFDTPILGVAGIQLAEYYSQYRNYSVFCDVIDSSRSLSNDKNSNYLKPTKQLAKFSNVRNFPILPCLVNELTNFTIYLLDEDMKPIKTSEQITLSIIIHHV